MALYSESELDIKAKATVLSIDRILEHHNIVAKITHTYEKFCESVATRKLLSGTRKLTAGVKLRILFEVLCYTVFLTTDIIAQHVSSRRLIRKKIDYDLVNCFNNQVARYLFKLCQDQGMSKFQEMVLLSSPPGKKIKFGDPLHPAKRLAEYAKYHEEKRGAEVELFGQYISMALDPYHFPVLQGLWKTQARTLLQVADRVMTEVFKPPVKLKR